MLSKANLRLILAPSARKLVALLALLVGLAAILDYFQIQPIFESSKSAVTTEQFYDLGVKIFSAILLTILSVVPTPILKVVGVNLSIFYFLMVGVDLGGQYYLASLTPDQRTKKVSGSLMKTFDMLTSNNIYTLITGGPPYEITKTSIVDGQLVPFGGVSNQLYVFCDESSGVIVYQSDRYGFRNADIVWNQTRKDSRVLILGDSYGQGACVNHQESLAGYLDGKYSVINLSVSGNGPYEMLAILSEYLGRVKPKLIVWLFYAGNDIGNLQNTMPGAIYDVGLNNYLSAEFNQELVNKQNEIDNLIKTAFDSRLTSTNKEITSVNSIKIDLVSALYMKNIAKIIYHRGLPYEKFEYHEDVWEKFSEILNRAKTIGDLEEIPMIFGVLHPVGSHKPSWYSQGRTRLAAKAISIARELGMTVYDSFEIIHSLPNGPETAYSFGKAGGHHNEYGYKVVSEGLEEVIGKVLKR